jgi:hypothetical protein
MANIIATQGDLKGNIGSCKVQETSVTTANEFWKSETTVILTNSCTGEIIKESTYPNYPIGALTIGVITIFVLFIGFRAIQLSFE